MSKRRKITGRKTEKTIDKKSETIPVAGGWNSMTNWLVVLVFVLPLIFSRITLDPAITVRYIFLGSFILLFVLYFFLVKKINFTIFSPVKIVFALATGYGVWSILSLFSATNPSPGYYETARHFLNTILLFIVFVTIQNEQTKLLTICKAIMLMSLIQSFVGIMQYYEVAFTDLPGAEPKPYGLMANRNIFGSAQAFLLPFVIFVLYKASKPWKYLSILAMTGIIVSVLVSQTRSAWLVVAGIVVFSLLLVIIFSSINRKRWLSGIMIGLPIVALLTALVILSDKEGDLKKSIKERAGSLVNVTTKISATAKEGSNERLKMWHLTAGLIKDHPVIGVGPGNWKLEIPKYDTTGLIWPNGKFLPTRPHNDYLQVASETGIPGGILFYAMWLMIIVIAVKIILKPGSEDQRILVILMASGLAGFAIDSMFSFPIERIEHSLFIYLIAGIILGNYTRLKENSLQKRRVNKILVPAFILISTFNIFMGYKKYNFEKHMNYAKAYENEKNYQDELMEVEAGKTSFVTIDPVGVPLEVRSSIAYKELKDYKNALIEINKAKKYHPNSAMIYNNIGIIYTEMKDFNKAIENYLKALKLAPKMDVALKNLAINYFNIENYTGCIEVLGRVEPNEREQFLDDLLIEAKRRLSLQPK